MVRSGWMRAVGAALLVAGCGTVEVFGRYDIPESEGVAGAPYPRLVDTPAAPAVGSYGEGVPDPAAGTAIVVDLTAEAAVAARRAAILADPTLTDAEQVMLLRETRRQ